MAKRLNNEVRKQVGILLAEEGLVNLAIVAKKLKVSARTLRSWKKLAMDGDYKKTGRPKKFKLAEKLKMIKKIKKEYLEQGCPGWRPICASLKGQVPTRLVQSTLAKIKRKERIKDREARVRKQVRVEVLKRNAVWTQDGTHLGRLKNKKEVQAQILKDRYTLETVSCHVGESSSAEDIKGILLNTPGDQLPLVWMTDNGSCYVNNEMQEFTNEKQIIHLKSFPHTPEHNGSCERHIRELKRMAGLGKGTCLESHAEASEMLCKAVWILSNKRRHGSKGYKTSLELKNADEKPLGDLREELYNRYKREMLVLKNNMQGLNLRRGEREMVFRLLSEFNLVRLTTRDG